MRISTLIIDDDADSRLVLSNYIHKNCPELIVCGEAETVAESITLIKKEAPDLLLLDISLPDGTAFDLLRQLPENKFEVIFITAYDKYAIEAFKFSAIDYLLKPIAFPQLNEALRKVGERIEEKYFKKHWVALTHNLRYKNPYDKRLSIAIGNDYIFVDVKEIIRLESHSNYTHFYFANTKKIVASHTLGYYEDILPPEYFSRIHNSHIVNIDFIDRYTKEGVGGTIILKDGTELSVSQRKKEVVLNLLVKNK
jgi:two-component system LytT family response regulator